LNEVNKNFSSSITGDIFPAARSKQVYFTHSLLIDVESFHHWSVAVLTLFSALLPFFIGFILLPPYVNSFLRSILSFYFIVNIKYEELVRIASLLAKKSQFKIEMI